MTCIGGLLDTVTGSVILTADEVKEVEGHIDQLQAENAKLREELADAPKCDACEAMLDCDECLRADGSHKERRRLSAENAKLREMVREMWLVMWACSEERCTHRENGCYRVNGNGGTPKGLGECWFAQRMRELGIEVDG